MNAQQAHALENRIQSAKDRLAALTGSAILADRNDSKALSEELGSYLNESMVLMEKCGLTSLCICAIWMTLCTLFD